MKYIMYICITITNKPLKLNIMTTLNNTFAKLTIGTIVTYNDMANTDLEFVILDSYSDDFGTWVNVMNLETKNIEPMKANTEIGNKWTV